MAGRGPTPKQNRARANEPGRGDWQPTEGIGWQHGAIPRPPTNLSKPSRDTWRTWFGSWFAAHWGPEDLPMLRTVIRLYDQVEIGRATAAERTELRQLADNYGITKKGQQDRRWTPPKTEAPAVGGTTPTSPAEPTGPYEGLRLVRPA